MKTDPRSRLLQVMTAILILLVSSVVEAAMTAAEAVNVSGRQRMLSQRIAKAYLMVGSEVDVIDARKQLDEVLALFEKQHQMLLDYAPNTAIRESLSAVEDAWVPYRELALEAPDSLRALRMLALSEKVLAAAENTVTLIEKESARSSAKLVNVAGRQRMLSQRIAKFYVAMAWRLEDPSVEKEFNKAMQEFEAGLATLQAARVNTPEISKALERVQSQWAFSKAGFRQYKEGRFVPTVITTTTESILRQMNEITAMYEAVMQKEKGAAKPR